MNDEALEIVSAAIEYAERGWHVFPVHGLRANGLCGCGKKNCPSVAKHPCIKTWPQEATTDNDRIIDWWEQFPTANVGIATGSASRLIVLDVDAPDALGGWASRTLTARTGKGFHFYFQQNGTPVKNSAGKLGNGIDVRGDGGYVVAPPSIHASRRHYEWVNPGAPLEIVPHWLLVCDPIPNGQRNDTLFKIAAGMRGRGENEQAILDELLRVNQERCVPPLSRIEVCQIRDSVLRYPQKIVVATPEKAEAQGIGFPQSAMIGSVGEFARTMARGTEVPEEFYYAAGLTVLGSLCADRLRVTANVDCEPRLYTVLLGQSADVKKSTALKRTISLFTPLLNPAPGIMQETVTVLNGAGSAEGLGRMLRDHKHVLLCYDELKALMDKASIEGSALLAMTASMFEGTRWSNPTKNPKQSIHVEDGHLSLLGCCTTETYGRIWSPEAISIGLPNRLFIVGADRRRKVAWPESPDQAQVEAITKRVREQLTRLPKTYDISARALARWTEWYESAPPSEHAKRLDTIGFRLMGLLALTNDRKVIDVETMDTLLSILDYEIKIRQLTDPIDADDRIARLEEKIRRVLKVRGPLKQRDLHIHTNARRTGLWAFDQAIKNLVLAGHIHQDKGTLLYVLAAEEGEAE